MVNGEEAELEWECAGSSLLPTPHTHVPPALGPGTPIFLSWGSWAPPPIKPKIFTVWSFREKFADSLYYINVLYVDRYSVEGNIKLLDG